MNLRELSNILERVYNTLGNDYLVRNFETDPFEFKVNVRKGGPDEIFSYVVEVYTDLPMPNSFKFRDLPKDKKKYNVAHISEIRHQFGKYVKYIDTSFRAPSFYIHFMNHIE